MESFKQNKMDRTVKSRDLIMKKEEKVEHYPVKGGRSTEPRKRHKKLGEYLYHRWGIVRKKGKIQDVVKRCK